MSEKDSLHGLTCPKCGGVVPVPEGQAIVRCPYCEMRSLVRGERGLLRYQVPQLAGRPEAVKALQGFLKSNLAIALDARSKAQLSEAFLVFLPFWAVWGRVAGWAFGEKKVGSGDSSHYEPREVRVVQEIAWNGAACDVGEFGVTRAPFGDQELEAFDPQALHSNGMVFEPVGSFSDARSTAESQFKEQVRHSAKLDRISQLFMRFFRRRYGLVYFPLWVLRYLYRGRAFQVVVDGHSGRVLYGKAPGNTLFRAAILVVGMALGAFLSVDASAFFIAASSDNSSEGNLYGLAIFAFLVGIVIMIAAYRRFRFGEQYEFRDKAASAPAESGSVDWLTTRLSSIEIGPVNLGEVEKWIERLS
jgi:DNA-directed RNA polymerase subunit RPC12/RpoP